VIAAIVLSGLAAVGCSREADDRTSMPADRKLVLDSMPQGPPPDSMAAEMERAWRGDSSR
jgi:hypothetical protein